MRTLRLIVAYDGTAYAGWQWQSRQVSVQQRMEEAWQKVTGESLRIIASGRTDAGVHARGQVCSLRTESAMDVGRLAKALSAVLPQDIVVEKAEQAVDGFHAIRDAVCKTYHYRVVAGPVRDVFETNRAWFVPGELQGAAIREAAASLVGTHDFSSFEASGSARQSTVRTVLRLEVDEQCRGRQYFGFTISADGFLYNMVRIIAGSLVQVGRGARDPEWLRQALAGRDRSLSGPTAPARGLCLVSVCYDDWCGCGAGECLGKQLPQRRHPGGETNHSGEDPGPAGEFRPEPPGTG